MNGVYEHFCKFQLLKFSVLSPQRSEIDWFSFGRNFQHFNLSFNFLIRYLNSHGKSDALQNIAAIIAVYIYIYININT